MKKRIKHNDLLPWFIRDHGTLPVAYLKDPRFGFQGDKHSFLTGELGLSESEYLTCLNSAADGDYWQ